MGPERVTDPANRVAGTALGTGDESEIQSAPIEIARKYGPVGGGWGR